MGAVMTLQRAIIYITGVFIAVGVAESQAGGPTPSCGLTIEINALRGGSPTVTVDGTKKITAKARIAKGSAPSGTTIDTKLRIEAVDGLDVVHSQAVSPVRLEIGKGGQGRKLTMEIPKCSSGSIDFVATFSGDAGNGAPCEATRTITKSCK
jgi:hypothetical protein